MLSAQSLRCGGIAFRELHSTPVFFRLKRHQKPWIKPVPMESIVDKKFGEIGSVKTYTTEKYKEYYEEFLKTCSSWPSIADNEIAKQLLSFEYNDRDLMIDFVKFHIKQQVKNLSRVEEIIIDLTIHVREIANKRRNKCKKTYDYMCKKLKLRNKLLANLRLQHYEKFQHLCQLLEISLAKDEDNLSAPVSTMNAKVRNMKNDYAINVYRKLDAHYSPEVLDAMQKTVDENVTKIKALCKEHGFTQEEVMSGPIKPPPPLIRRGSHILSSVTSFNHTQCALDVFRIKTQEEGYFDRTSIGVIAK